MIEEVSNKTNNEKTRTVSVVLFKESGKYYSEESWRVPNNNNSVGPAEMVNSPDYHRIGKGKVLITSDSHVHAPNDQNWGYPHLI